MIQYKKAIIYTCDRCRSHHDIYGIHGSLMCIFGCPAGVMRPDIKFPEWVTVRKFNVDSGYSHIGLHKVESIKTGQGRKKGVWMVDRKAGGKIARVYMTCLVCGTINNVSDNHVDEEGRSECFRCPKCAIYHIVQFEGITIEERLFMKSERLRAFFERKLGEA